MKKLKLFSGNSNPVLAKKICDYLGVTLGQATVSTFSDGEIYVKIGENVRISEMFNTTLKPPVGKFHRFFCIRSLAGVGSALIECHDDIGPDRSLDIRCVLRSEKVR